MTGKPDKTIWLITLMCILLGFLSVMAVAEQKSETEIGGVASLQNIEKLVNEKNSLEKEKEELEQIIAQHETKLKEYENSLAEKPSASAGSEGSAGNQADSRSAGSERAGHRDSVE